MFTHEKVEIGPQLLDGIEFRRVRRPVHDDDTVLILHVLENSVCDVATRTILHEDESQAGAVTDDTGTDEAQTSVTLLVHALRSTVFILLIALDDDQKRFVV